jgi:hypothetical protein
VARRALADGLGYAASFARFPLDLRRFLADAPDPAAARSALVRRLAEREDRFLALVEERIFAAPRSPYRWLFERAGCDAGDLRAAVRSRGLEGALRELRAAGVFVGFEEIKGRRPIVRDGRELPVAPRDFDNPAARHHFRLTTGGSTGHANAVYQDLEHIAELADDELVALDAFGAARAPTVHWGHGLPDSTLRYLLQRARHGDRRPAWFTPIGWRDSASWAKYGAASLYMIAALRAAGVRVAPPRRVPPAEAGTVAREVRARIDRAGACLLSTTVSRAVRVALAAVADGLDLAGCTVRLRSEPLTPAKRERIERSGARVLAGYGRVETGAIGLGCGNPEHPDEVHLLADAFALVDHPHVVPGGDVVPAFHLTGLRASAPKILLNYGIDDCGTIGRRACGCTLEKFGWTEHLHTIRSFGKWVGEGVTLIGNDLLDLLEREMPARFGGSPLDWQLAEVEDGDGLTRVELVVGPGVALADPGAVVPFFLDRLRSRSPMTDAGRTVWQAAGTVRLVRREPHATERGKLQPLDLSRARR